MNSNSFLRHLFLVDWCCRPSAVGVHWYSRSSAWICLADALTRCSIRSLCEAHGRIIEV